MSFAALHVHSQYSILESTLSVEEIAQTAHSLELPAVALTDSGNMFGVVDFYKACKEKKVPSIIGSEVWLAPTSRFEKKKLSSSPIAFPLILLAKDKQGYQNLCKISSLGYLEGFYYHPRIDKEVLQRYSKGLICLSGPLSGSVPYKILHATEEELFEEVRWFLEVFGEDYYFELQRHPMSEERIAEDGMERESWQIQNLNHFVRDQEKVIAKLVELSKRFSIPTVATQDVHYRNREDWKAHEILLNIQAAETCEIWEYDSSGRPKRKVPNPKRRTYSSHEFYFKTPEEMARLFQDIPEAISNTIRVAQKCNCGFDFSKKYYPTFSSPSSDGTKKEASQILYSLCKEAIALRYSEGELEKVRSKYPNEDPKIVVEKRLDFEFEIISSKELCDYFLIVFDFISWAKKREIPVGPGRGSVAGSIIAYLLGITEIEPLQFHLFFERFINPERLSYPDIDVDICMDRRSEVIDYTIQKYGKDRVAQIITFGTMKAKMAIRDVGRVLNVPLSKVNTIAKLVPEDLNITIEKALEVDVELKALYEEDEEAHLLLDMAQRLEGSIRNTSLHAAGVIISADPLTDHVPVCLAKDSTLLVTQFSMKPVEMVGLLKIDFLGLKTLTSLQKATEMVMHNRKIKLEWNRLPLDDKKTYDLLNQGKTLGVFQLESGGIQDLAKQLHIDHFEEIIAVEALYRPGPMDMIPSYINRKQKKEAIEIDHPLMKEILEETYGVMVYQEQVMQIASKLADYSLGEGDVLRRAMGKKDRQEMEKQREKFVKGASKKGIDDSTAIRIFDKIEKFASYGFNKSHATAYAYLTYATSYFKANFPEEWMAALMTVDRDDLSKVAKFIRECKSLNIAILSPDVNESRDVFTATKEGIRFAITAIKGVGEGVVLAILEERKKGPFKSLYDFIRRIDKNRIGKKTIELLVDAGAFDFTQWSRDSLRESVNSFYEEASRDQKELEKGILSLFSLSSAEETAPKEPRFASKKEDLLKRERELLGFYLSSHPMENYQKLISDLRCVALKDLEDLPQDTLVPVAFIIEELVFKISSKNQKKFAILTISDGLERFELPIWNEMYEEKNALLREGQLLLSTLQIDKREGSLKLQCRSLEDLTKIDELKIASMKESLSSAKKQQGSFERKKIAERKKEEVMRVEIKLDIDAVHLSEILGLKKILKEHVGSNPVLIRFLSGSKSVGSLALERKVQMSDPFKEKLKKMDSFLEISSVQ
jgi:DNA polymerase III subunit alpha